MIGGRFEIGQNVIYGTNGLCRVEDIKEMSFITGETKKAYYILEPLRTKASTIFVPLKNEKLVSKMRSVMTKTEIDALLLGMPDKEIIWESDRRTRADLFHDIITKGVTEELLLLIRCIYMKKKELEALNKNISMTDSKSLEFAEKMVEEEFSYALGIKPAEVGNYIRKNIGVKE